MNWRFGKTIELQGGGYGNGFLTKLPILNYENIKFKMLTDNEPRAFMKLRLKIGTDTLVFVNTHFDHNKNDKERINLAKQLMENLENVNQPVIICGDLNDTPKSETLDILTSGFSDVWSLIKREEKATFPAGDPERRIDYILTSIKETAHGQLKPLSIKILESLASDHLPVIMEIRINQ
jgi:endonuclease/exonuclease/phosphatase family metal-dependent hydrolase